MFSSVYCMYKVEEIMPSDYPMTKPVLDGTAW